MLRIISLLILLLSTIGRNFYKIGSTLSFVLYTIALFNDELIINDNWFKINNINLDFSIYFGKLETLICSIICLILTILHYSADILYKNDDKSNTLLNKYFTKINAILKTIYGNIKYELYKYYNKYNSILCKNNNNTKVIFNKNCNKTSLVNIQNKLKLLNIFAFSMCLAICSKNVWQFYISLELLGLISSIFIGIESHNKSASVVYIYNKFASIIFLFGTILYLINIKSEVSAICFTIACLCKSAQLPFSNWLIRATKANTLASILIHCATIIGVGVIFFYKFYYLFIQYSYLFNVILFISLLTSLVYPIVALYETNIKKIIACLTISSTGTMFTFCALKQYLISVNYFLCHAFFKSLLFLIFAYYIEYFKTKDIRQFYNLKYFNTVGLISVLSCMGIPPFIGFFPKVLINKVLSNYSIVIQLLLELSNCLIYTIIFKLYLQYFKTNKNSISVKFNIKPIYLLIIFSIIYGFIFIKILYDININDIFHSNNLKNICVSIIENFIVIIIAYIIAKYAKNIPFIIGNKLYILIYNIQYFNKISKKLFFNIPKYINKINNKIESFYRNILYNYQYKLACILEKTNSDNYKKQINLNSGNVAVQIYSSHEVGQIKNLVIGIVIVCIILLF